jgi:hypothetical protein
MAEIKTKLISVKTASGGADYLITPAHSIKDVLRHLIVESSYEEIFSLIKELEEKHD